MTHLIKIFLIVVFVDKVTTDKNEEFYETEDLTYAEVRDWMYAGIR